MKSLSKIIRRKCQYFKIRHTYMLFKHTYLRKTILPESVYFITKNKFHGLIENLNKAELGCSSIAFFNKSKIA